MMRCLRCAALVGALATACGCTTHVPVVTESIPCEIPTALLQERCADPVALADGATYADVLAAANEDRNNLRTCGARNRLLASVLVSCNEALEQDRAKVQDINARFGVKQ